MYTKKNDFIVLGKTQCYFIDWVNLRICIGEIIAYNNINRTVTIRCKYNYNPILKDYEYIIVYRGRDYIWFRLECALEWFNNYLRDYGMISLKVMDLTDQLDGIKTTFNLSRKIGRNYTIYINGLRQNRENFIIDDNNHTITVVDLDEIPNQHDILTIEYLQVEDVTQ